MKITSSTDMSPKSAALPKATNGALPIAQRADTRQVDAEVFSAMLVGAADRTVPHAEAESVAIATPGAVDTNGNPLGNAILQGLQAKGADLQELSRLLAQGPTSPRSLLEIQQKLSSAILTANYLGTVLRKSSDAVNTLVRTS